MNKSRVFPSKYVGNCSCCGERIEVGDFVQYVDGEICLAECMTPQKEAAREAVSARMRRELEAEGGKDV